MLKEAKIAILQAAERLGVFRAVLASPWRRNRLLILCYHGTSLDDEHQWDGSLYISPKLLRERMQALVDYGCTVLPLDEALRRLYSDSLPPRSVAITYDDGTYDFYAAAWPILREYGFPVTVYLTTYYSGFNRPVFDVMLSYLLWKGRDRGRLEWPEILPAAVTLDQPGRRSAQLAIRSWAAAGKLSGSEKDAVLAGLAGKLGIDYEALCRKRLLHIMTPEEARQVAEQGVSLELHTHRHRVSRDRGRFVRELDDNRDRIRKLTESDPRHFCYPGGVYLPEFTSYLSEYGLASATTCVPGLCTPESERMQLPRLVDTSGLSSLEFRSWLAGMAAFMPRRPYVPADGQLAEES